MHFLQKEADTGCDCNNDEAPEEVRKEKKLLNMLNQDKLYCGGLHRNTSSLDTS